LDLRITELAVKRRCMMPPTLEEATEEIETETAIETAIATEDIPPRMDLAQYGEVLVEMISAVILAEERTTVAQGATMAKAQANGRGDFDFDIDHTPQRITFTPTYNIYISATRAL